MKTIIIDDEQTSIDALTQKLQSYDDITIAGTAQSGLKGIVLVRNTQPDLLFIDVEMPDMSGLEFLNQIGNIIQKPCKVVIYTAHSNYILPAFRGKAFDFLLKPIDDKELKNIIQRAYIENDGEQKPSCQQHDKLLLYMNATDFCMTNTNDVGLFQYNRELRVWEVLVAGRQEPVRLKRTTSNDTLLNLDPRFIQVSQRHIININYLMEVSDNLCRLYPPFDKITDVKVGRTFRKLLTEKFNSL